MARRRKAEQLTRRERQIMDILYETGRASAAEVLERLPDPPSYSTVRALLRILEEKGHVRHESDGPRYAYLPTVSRDRARRRALAHLVQTFFEGSAERALATLISERAEELDPEQLDRLADLIEQARREGR